jgi:hypothetical protein
MNTSNVCLRAYIIKKKNTARLSTPYGAANISIVRRFPLKISLYPFDVAIHMEKVLYSVLTFVASLVNDLASRPSRSCQG